MSRVINLQIEQVAIDLLKHHPRNANHGDVDAIKKSLAVNGWYGSVVANLSTKHILAGNHRVMAAKALGWETVPVQWVDVTPEEELRILVVDNRTTRIGQDDTTKITDILAELANTPIGLDGTGYSAGDLDALIDSLTGTGELEELLTDPDEVPEVVETRCQPGDLWILGSHRLLCGDSTKADDVERLMDGATVDAVVTDPPYGTGIDAKKGLGNSSIPMSLIGDHDATLARKSFMQWKTMCSKQVWWGANYFSDVIDGIDSWIVWDKDHHGMTFADAELAYCSVGGPVRVFRHAWSGAHKASEKGEKRQHPTQKPVALYTWILETYIKDKCIVVDPFLGSGSGLIACELFQCKCYGLELDPHYCDVIIQRWENATGKKAVLDEG
jgi:hypothetical protein